MLPSFGDRRCYRETYIRWETDAILFKAVRGMRYLRAEEARLQEVGRAGQSNDIAKFCRTLAICGDHLDALLEEGGDWVPMLQELVLLVNTSHTIPEGTGNITLQRSAYDSVISDHDAAFRRARARHPPNAPSRMVDVCVRYATRDSRFKLKPRYNRPPE
jgi:hypothetical protein